MKVGVITLGCDKNTVDSERYAASLVARGAEMTTDLGEAGIILINTCGTRLFSKSINELLQALRWNPTKPAQRNRFHRARHHQPIHQRPTNAQALSRLLNPQQQPRFTDSAPMRPNRFLLQGCEAGFPRPSECVVSGSGVKSACGVTA